MPSVTCQCRNRIDLGAIPNPNEYLLISDDDYDKYSGVVDTELLYSAFIHILKCPECERLIVFWGGFDHDPVFYSKSDGRERT